MSIAYSPRTESNKLTIAKGKTLGQLLTDNGLAGQLDTVALYNWGTKLPQEINRALVELVGCETIADDPLNSVLDPGRGTRQPIHKHVPWAPELATEKTYTVTVKRRRAPTAVAITGLTALFNPSSENCTVRWRLEGDPGRAHKRDIEVHATGYYAVVKDREGTGTEDVEKPCGTDAVNDLSHTHIYRGSIATAAPGDETISWDSASQATEGVLKNAAHITSRCAPYPVLIRYYEDDADKDVKLKLEPFYPQWTLTGRARRVLDEKSLVVKWKLEGPDPSKAKLKNGQISVWDKNGCAFFAPLTKEQIAAGTYDLLKGPVKWDKTKVDPKKMPYRIQIQAHSDGDEEQGLALATMPTQVPAYTYKQVQLIGFNVRNDVNSTGDYLGSALESLDISRRCDVMIQAIQRAHGNADPNRKILKVFVAPEFYFRGRTGAYPVESIPSIVPRLQAETDKYEYLDWLFVFGTAIGYQKHESDTGGKITHGEAIHDVEIVTVDSLTKITAKVWSTPQQGWLFQKGAVKRKISAPVTGAAVLDATDSSATLTIALDSTALLAAGDDAEMVEPQMKVVDTWPPLLSTKTQIKVASKLCGRIPVDPATKDVVTIGGGTWEAVSNGITSTITKVDFKQSEGFYWLTLAPGGAYESGKPLTLLEPVATEVFNVALVQKGWHAPHLGDGSLRQVVIYKEKVSPIDFIASPTIVTGSRVDRKKFHAASGTGRKIKIHGDPSQPVLPTEGGKDVGGASPNLQRRPESAVGSEINETGLGGGSVFTVDGVTFGLEVCLDHGKDRLYDFYDGPNKRKGDPKVQVQLIPSWGMSIGGSDPDKEVTALANGLVFNVDGNRMESVARKWDRKYSCDAHVTVTSNGAGKCPTCNANLQKMGTSIARTSRTTVPLSNNPAYFKREGNVEVFPPQRLPDPDVVT